jgi:hypothetical protein
MIDSSLKRLIIFEPVNIRYTPKKNDHIFKFKSEKAIRTNLMRRARYYINDYFYNHPTKERKKNLAYELHMALNYPEYNKIRTALIEENKRLNKSVKNKIKGKNNDKRKISR